jgi:CheY-like chemotaxis protein
MTQVLVVEDDSSVARLLVIVLGAEGYDVISAEDGLDALSKVRTRTPDVIVLDLSMPRMDGRTFVRTARAMGLESRFIILSAFGAARACAELHCDAAVEKPFDPEELARTVGELVRAA